MTNPARFWSYPWQTQLCRRFICNVSGNGLSLWPRPVRTFLMMAAPAQHRNPWKIPGNPTEFWAKRLKFSKDKFPVDLVQFHLLLSSHLVRFVSQLLKSLVRWDGFGISWAFISHNIWWPKKRWKTLDSFLKNFLRSDAAILFLNCLWTSAESVVLNNSSGSMGIFPHLWTALLLCISLVGLENFLSRDNTKNRLDKLPSHSIFQHWLFKLLATSLGKFTNS